MTTSSTLQLFSFVACHLCSKSRSEGALVGGQHSRILKNEILCCVSSFEAPTHNIALCSRMWQHGEFLNIYCQHPPMIRNVIQYHVFSIFKSTFKKYFSTSPDVIPLCSILHVHISRSIFQTDRKLSARDSARVFLVYQREMFFCWMCVCVLMKDVEHC